MTRIKLGIQYQGTGLYGWQAQASGVPTVEGHLQAAWEQLTGGAEPGKTFHVAGRTDAGVHAWGQVAHIDTDWKHAHTLVKVRNGLNRFLPPQVRVVRVAIVDDTFHARFGAVERAYTYLLYHRPSLRPDLIGRAGHVREGRERTLDVPRMQAALELLPLGASDFSGFRDAECQSKRPVCNLVSRRLVDLGEGLLQMDIRADHFLHHMVRNIMGTLVGIGLGDRPVGGLADVLAARDRTQAGMTFSPDGLYLTDVRYLPHWEGDTLTD